MATGGGLDFSSMAMAAGAAAAVAREDDNIMYFIGGGGQCKYFTSSLAWFSVHSFRCCHTLKNILTAY
jgi:hypothetical protein